MNAITLVFRGNLSAQLTDPRATAEEIRYPLARRASIKDIIEALGVPHPEVDGLRRNGAEIDFTYLPVPQDRIEILPHVPPVDVCSPTCLRPEPLPAVAFAVDANVAKLAPLLRMIGMDCWYQANVDDDFIADLSRRQQRILLTRDTGLLKRKQVVYGHLVRAQEPSRQLREIIEFYGLRPLLTPFSRCLLCNGKLQAVEKNDIRHRLEPLTEKYYDSFRRCGDCEKIYWPGSHRQRMERSIAATLAETGP